jgi:hypothetical protein
VSLQWWWACSHFGFRSSYPISISGVSKSIAAAEFQSTLTQAGAADSGGAQFVDQCHTAIAMRRAWSIPVVAFGASLLGALMISPSRQHSANASPESIDAI